MVLRPQYSSAMLKYFKPILSKGVCRLSTCTNYINPAINRQPLILPKTEDNFIEIKYSRSHSEVLRLHQTWLRHHCRCSECYNHTTHQRLTKFNPELLNSKISEINIEDDLLHCIWNDKHNSTFDLNWINVNALKVRQESHGRSNSGSPPPPPPKVATISSTEELLAAGVDFKGFLTDDNILKIFLKNLVSLGSAVISNAPNTADATLMAVHRISHQQRTFYGDGPTITGLDLEHKDMAYTNEFLDLHTDTSYFSEPMGLQVFHLLSQGGTGGSNSISDGFHAARLLFEDNPELYTTLTTAPILSEYFEGGKQFYSEVDVVLSHNWFTGVLERVRFNPSDMGTLKYNHPQNLTSLYEALVRFATILEKEAKWITLRPGTILFLDNWRTLHGRSQFTGQRSMASVYVGRSDWLSKARLMDGCHLI